MKKTAFAFLAMIFCASMTMADDIKLAGSTTPTAAEKTIIVYSPSKQVQTSSGIFWAWSAVSFGSGIIAAVNGDATGHGLGVGMITYGLADTLIAIYGKNYGDWPSDDEAIRKQLVDVSGSHAVYGLAQIAAGVCIGVLAKNNLSGFGYAMAIQGGFFAISNGINYYVASNPGTVNPMGAGVNFIAPLASLNF
jgi:hypothetical protein